MFHKLERTNNSSYMITHKRAFSPDDPYHTGKHMHLNKETVKDIFEFAYDMSFEEGSEHRAHRSGEHTKDITVKFSQMLSRENLRIYRPWLSAHKRLYSN